MKGAGEGGTIPAAAAIVSAIEDARRPLGVRIDEAPILPERLCELIDQAAERQSMKRRRTTSSNAFRVETDAASHVATVA